MESKIALESLLDLMPEFDKDEAGLERVSMTSVAGNGHVPIRVKR